MRRFSRQIQMVMALSISLCATWTAATGQVDFRWNDPNGGAFNDPNNWNSPFPGSIPGLAVRTVFDLPNAYTVTFPANPVGGTVSSVRRGNVIFDLEGNNYTLGDMFIGEFADNITELTIVDGTLNPIATTLGEADPSIGTVIVGEGGRFEPNSFLVGNHGIGSLLIQDGGLVTAAGTRVGNQLTGHGTIQVTGTDGSGNRSTFAEAGHIIVGTQGHGEMHISGGALLQTNPNTAAERSDVIGQFPAPGVIAGLGATGEVTIDGVGPDGTPSTWISTGPLHMGNVSGGTFAQGMMTITGGGQATHTKAFLLGSAEAPNRVEIRGTDAADNPSNWTLTSGQLDLIGEVLVADGASFESRGVSMGPLAGYKGQLTITGSSANGVRSSYIGPGFSVGGDGDGEFNVTDGAIVTAPGAIGNLFVGSRSTSDGKVLISGRDAFDNPATLTLGRNITIGSEGSASLTVSDGGVLTTGFDDPLSFGLIALRDTAVAVTVLVTGKGSTWSHARNLTVGGGAASRGGFADMIIDDNATVNIGGTLKIWDTSGLIVSGGTLTVDVLEMAAGSDLQFGIGGTQPGTNHGQMLLGDDALLDGNLEIALRDGYLPKANDEFTLLSALDVQGVFENVAPGGRLFTEDHSGSFQVDYGFGSPFGTGKIVLSDFAENSLTADVDGDFDVDGADFFIIQRTNPALIPDWQSQFGTISSFNVTQAQSVPEPPTGAMLLLGAAALLRRWELRRTCVAATVILAVNSQGIYAQVEYSWVNPTGGDFNDAANWQGPSAGQIPNFFAQAMFNLPGTYTVDFSATRNTDSSVIRAGEVVFDLHGNTYILSRLFSGESFGDIGNLRIQNGAVSTTGTTLGAAEFSEGTIVVAEDGLLRSINPLEVGELGMGTLRIENGGHGDVGLAFVAESESGVGLIEVIGANVEGNPSTLTTSRRLVVGRRGIGELRITAGGLVESNPNTSPGTELVRDVVGEHTGAVGQVFVDGVGNDGTASTWISTGPVNLGDADREAQGFLTVTGGAQVTHTAARLEGTDTAPSRVEIRGTDADNNPSLWSLTEGPIDVAGEVVVADGGQLVGSALVGTSSGDTGSLFVRDTSAAGVRSSYISSGDVIGVAGLGILNVLRGGVVSSPNFKIGLEPGSHGEVFVSGRDVLGNAAELIADNIEVGLEGTATLTAATGGSVSSSNLQIGVSSIGGGSVLVNGRDDFGNAARLSISNEIVVGSDGTGSLAIFNGGVASSPRLQVGVEPGSVGEIVISGRDSLGNASRINISDGADVVFAREGDAVITVVEGGKLTTGFGDSPRSGQIALLPGSSASVSVTGSDSSWSHAGSLIVGGSVSQEGGEATLSAADQATIDVNQALTFRDGDLLHVDGGRVQANKLFLKAGSTLEFTVESTQPPNDFGKVVLADDAFLDGVLNIELHESFVPSEFDSIILIEASDFVSGSFVNAAPGQRLLTADGNASFRVDYGPDSPFDPVQVVLSEFAAVTFTTDTDGDFDVDGADFLNLQRSNPDMIATWKTEFGQSFPPSTLRAVPEPSTWAMLLLVGVAALLRRAVTYQPGAERSAALGIS